jgi:hypothetical protein
MLSSFSRRPLRRAACSQAQKKSQSAKNLEKVITKAAFEELLQIKIKNGKLGYEDVSTIVKQYHKLGHKFLKRRQLTYLLETHAKRTTCEDVVGVTVGDTLINGLFDNDTSSLTVADANIIVASVDETNCVGDVVDDRRNMGGRPKKDYDGKEASVSLQLAKTEAATNFQTMLREIEKSKVSRVQKGSLLKIINDAETKYNISHGTISKRTIRNRVIQNYVTGISMSRISPLADVEPVIIQYCLRLATMGAALSKDQVMSLATDCIHKTKYAKQLADFKRILRLPVVHKKDTDNNQTDKVSVGVGWYRNFMNRHSDKLTRQRLRVKDAKRMTYCTYDNFKLMYETVYEEMVECGIAEKLDEEVFVNWEGEIVQNIEDSKGLPTTYLMKKPELIVFVDETGCNTNQKTNPLNGNQKRILSD